MDKCPFFKQETKYLKSRELRGHMGAAPLIAAHYSWCAHPKHSPVPEVNAKGTLGGANRLHCGGDVNRCQIAPELRGDLK